jgi:hypothetical protein
MFEPVKKDTDIITSYASVEVKATCSSCGVECSESGEGGDMDSIIDSLTKSLAGDGWVIIDYKLQCRGCGAAAMVDACATQFARKIGEFVKDQRFSISLLEEVRSAFTDVAHDLTPTEVEHLLNTVSCRDALVTLVAQAIGQALINHE